MQKKVLLWVLLSVFALAAGAQEAPPVTRRAREIIDLGAQFERCRLDAPGFAEKSAGVHAAWTRRHAAVLSQYERTIELKVRVGRRSENMLPLRLCTDDWLRAIEPLSRAPDARFQTVEKTWQVFVLALMNADRGTVLECLSGRLAARWQERAARLSNEDLRRIGASIRGFKLQWGDDYAKEGLVADADNRVVGVAFTRNVNEEWRISEFGAAATTAPAQ